MNPQKLHPVSSYVSLKRTVVLSNNRTLGDLGKLGRGNEKQDIWQNPGEPGHDEAHLKSIAG